MGFQHVASKSIQVMEKAIEGQRDDIYHKSRGKLISAIVSAKASHLNVTRMKIYTPIEIKHLRDNIFSVRIRMNFSPVTSNFRTQIDRETDRQTDRHSGM